MDVNAKQQGGRQLPRAQHARGALEWPLTPLLRVRAAVQRASTAGQALTSPESKCPSPPNSFKSPGYGSTLSRDMQPEAARGSTIRVDHALGDSASRARMREIESANSMLMLENTTLKEEKNRLADELKIESDEKRAALVPKVTEARSHTSASTAEQRMSDMAAHNRALVHENALLRGEVQQLRSLAAQAAASSAAESGSEEKARAGTPIESEIEAETMPSGYRLSETRCEPSEREMDELEAVYVEIAADRATPNVATTTAQQAPPVVSATPPMSPTDHVVNMPADRAAGVAPVSVPTVMPGS